jgi:hypothetical protein
MSPLDTLSPLASGHSPMFLQVSVAEDRRFELLRGCPQHAFQQCCIAFTGVHRRPPPSASRANTIRVTTGERPRTWMNEPKTEPRPGAKACCPGCGGRVAGRSSAACVAVTGRRQRFVVHGSQIAPIADSALSAAVPDGPGNYAQNLRFCARGAGGPDDPHRGRGSDLSALPGGA